MSTSDGNFFVVPKPFDFSGTKINWLQVIANRYSRYQASTAILFEGRGDGYKDWGAMLTRLTKEAKSAMKDAPDETSVFMIGVSGKTCRFFRCKLEEGTPVRTYMAFENGQVNYRWDGDRVLYDITDEREQDSVKAFLRAIRDTDYNLPS